MGLSLTRSASWHCFAMDAMREVLSLNRKSLISASLVGAPLVVGGLVLVARLQRPLEGLQICRGHRERETQRETLFHGEHPTG